MKKISSIINFLKLPWGGWGQGTKFQMPPLSQAEISKIMMDTGFTADQVLGSLERALSATIDERDKYKATLEKIRDSDCDDTSEGKRWCCQFSHWAHEVLNE